ncbi:DUF456 family protein [Ornithinibacillus gellani]|uniref:DUF456 domain-containing protein n=1 Tax=Ornithinibacillus gellani TaxID=2293253 RepID=UPI000F47A038|nr:DUF456 family protein [Ornithinibacillus gellani]TQS76479.1 DUF456 family protein [Ornithinibacillus gellani]
MADMLLWILIIVLFIGSFVGLLFPIIPSSLLLWVGFLLYHFIIGHIGTTFWIAMIVFTIFLFGADILANRYFVKRFGGSVWGERIAAIAVIIGSFIIPPFGIIIIPFAAVLVTEMIQERTMNEAIRASIGSLFGFLGGTFAKAVIQVIMIIWFLIAI